MKIGIITDVHNNVVALEQVLQRLESENCDYIVCCGDIIGIGPYPEQTVQRMMKIPNLITVRGNHDGYLLDGIPDTFPNDELMEPSETEYHKWEHGQLSESSVEFLSKLPFEKDISCYNKKITILHYCMNGENKYINYSPNPTDDDLMRMFANYDSDIILFGHDHGRTIRNINGKWYINVGSLGCPAMDKNIARAGILQIDENHISVDAIDLEYDAQTVVDEIDRINFPSAVEIKMYFFGIR